MARKKIKSTTDQRPFIIVYHDFLDNNLLTDTYEIVLFIALKKFADDKNQCFPSLEKLSKITRMSRRKIQDTLKELEKKHVIGIEKRSRKDGGNTSNLYTLYDYKELWNSDNNEKMTEIIDEIEEKRMIEVLTAKGYHISKEKELESVPAKAQNQALKSNNSNQFDNTSNPANSQDLERYTIDQIKQFFDYDIMLHDNPYSQQDIDSVMDILYTTLNTNKETIRIAGQDKPSMVVISKLMKLHHETIMYAIERYHKQTERIKNPTSYMLTILYSAPEQFNLDIQNQVSHDMAHWNDKK